MIQKSGTYIKLIVPFYVILCLFKHNSFFSVWPNKERSSILYREKEGQTRNRITISECTVQNIIIFEITHFQRFTKHSTQEKVLKLIGQMPSIIANLAPLLAITQSLAKWKKLVFMQNFGFPIQGVGNEY